MFPQDPVRFILSVKVACQRHFILDANAGTTGEVGSKSEMFPLKRRKGQSRCDRVDRWKFQRVEK